MSWYWVILGGRGSLRIWKQFKHWSWDTYSVNDEKSKVYNFGPVTLIVDQ